MLYYIKCKTSLYEVSFFDSVRFALLKRIWVFFKNYTVRKPNCTSVISTKLFWNCYSSELFQTRLEVLTTRSDPRLHFVRSPCHCYQLRTGSWFWCPLLVWSIPRQVSLVKKIIIIYVTLHLELLYRGPRTWHQSVFPSIYISMFLYSLVSLTNLFCKHFAAFGFAWPTHCSLSFLCNLARYGSIFQITMRKSELCLQKRTNIKLMWL